VVSITEEDLGGEEKGKKESKEVEVKLKTPGPQTCTGKNG